MTPHERFASGGGELSSHLWPHAKLVRVKLPLQLPESLLELLHIQIISVSLTAERAGSDGRGAMSDMRPRWGTNCADKRACVRMCVTRYLLLSSG